MRIDSHQHFWHYQPEEFGWITDGMAVLRRDFLPSEITAETEHACVDGTVVVQARQSLEETRWLLSIAQEAPVAGVVGWAPLEAENFDALFEGLRQEPLLKGLRHVVQAEPDGFLLRPEFERGIRRLTESGLVYDVLIRARQMPEALAFVDAHPRQAFVLDHMGKPEIASGEFDDWARQLRALARRLHVSCKVSGLVTEADPTAWTAEQLNPYFDVALEAFGAERLMIGTDWPVCTVGCSYGEWWQVVERWTSPLSASERDQILGETAARVYKLNGAGGKGGV